MFEIGNSLIQDLLPEIEFYKSHHPSFPLYIFCSKKNIALKRKEAINISVNLRGIITDLNHNILYRGFGRFPIVHLSDLIALKAPTIMHKLDGSLGIMYWHNNMPFISSKRSFDSFQAIIGTYMLYTLYKNKFSELDINQTFLFEIISPEVSNLIDYKSMSSLILLACYDHKNNFYRIPETRYFKTPSMVSSIEEAISLKNDSNLEGFVIKSGESFFKCKFESYYSKYNLNEIIKNNIIREKISLKKTERIVDCQSHINLLSKSNNLYEYIISSIDNISGLKKVSANEYLQYRFNKPISDYIIMNSYKLSTGHKIDFINNLYSKLFKNSQYYDEMYFIKNDYVLNLFNKTKFS